METMLTTGVLPITAPAVVMLAVVTDAAAPNGMGISTLETQPMLAVVTDAAAPNGMGITIHDSPGT